MRTATRLTVTSLALLTGITLARAETAPKPDALTPAPQVIKPAHPMMPAAMGTGHGGGHGMMARDADGVDMMPGQHIEGRLGFQKAELAITDAQLPQWTAYAEAQRAAVKAMRAAMTATMQGGIPVTAPARTDAMIAMMTARLDTMKSIAGAQKAFYAVLTDAQKQVADELMMSGMGGMAGMEGMRGHP